MVSEIDIRDWERAEEIIDSLSVQDDNEGYKWEAGTLTFEQYVFLTDMIEAAKSQYKKPKLPAILSWWRAA